MQPTQLCVAPSVDSFCAASRRLSLRELVTWSLHDQTLWEPCHEGRVGLWGVEDELLRAHGLEEGSLQRLGEAGR